MSNTYSIATVKELMNKHNLFPKKRFGQNFLVDQNVLHKIVAATILSKNDYVVEIGPGFGALTQKLAQKSKNVLTIDIDKTLEPVLEEVFHNYDNISVLFKDILETDLEDELKKEFNYEDENLTYKVCANIPYNITTPIIFKLLETCPNMISATLMIQKEVAQRIVAKPGNKDYGLLTIMVAYYADVENVMNVSKNCFYPKPDVDSTVIKITPNIKKREIVKNEIIFKNLVRAAFQKRRKTILNICSDHFNLDKTTLTGKLNTIGISPALRPENLTLEEFAQLADLFI